MELPVLRSVGWHVIATAASRVRLPALTHAGGSVLTAATGVEMPATVADVHG